MKGKINRKNILLFLVLITLVSKRAYADMIWPALLLEQGMLKWWVIGTGLLIEWGFLQWFLDCRCRWIESLKFATVMNLVSGLLGIPLIPLGGILLEFFPGSLLHHFFKGGTIILTILFASFINAWIERWIIVKFFKQNPIRKRTLLWFFGVNLITVGMAVASLILEQQ